MIEINLIPVNQRKRKRSQLLGIIKIPLEIVIGSFLGVLMLLIMVHAGLLMINLWNLSHHANLKKEWEVITPAKENVDKVIKEMRVLQTKQKSIDQITTGSRILWAQKLNILSNSIVRGVWLTRLRLNEGTLYIEGSAISKQSDQIIGVHSFTANLKNDDIFVSNFSGLELDSIQRRYVGKTEVADFLITAQLLEENSDVN
jgi:Tfp pilus assembly protein PilN